MGARGRGWTTAGADVVTGDAHAQGSRQLCQRPVDQPEVAERETALSGVAPGAGQPMFGPVKQGGRAGVAFPGRSSAGGLERGQRCLLGCAASVQ